MRLEFGNGGAGEHGHPVFATLGLADHNLTHGEIHVLHPELQRLQQPEPASVHQHRRDPPRARQAVQQKADLVAVEVVPEPDSLTIPRSVGACGVAVSRGVGGIPGFYLNGGRGKRSKNA